MWKTSWTKRYSFFRDSLLMHQTSGELDVEKIPHKSLDENLKNDDNFQDWNLLFQEGSPFFM